MSSTTIQWNFQMGPANLSLVDGIASTVTLLAAIAPPLQYIADLH